ncbi:MAG TPA: VOC family protein [Blastocatellia bacterium]|nr:VOC family protein [Blastocatellia bacterium]
MGQPVLRWQIISKNPDQTADFYCRLFDWSVNTDNALGYHMIETQSGRGAEGGVWPCPPEGHATVVLYIAVDDVAAYVEKARQLGGNVIIPPQKLPDGDEMAVIYDPEGLAVGLFKPAKT